MDPEFNIDSSLPFALRPFTTLPPSSFSAEDPQPASAFHFRSSSLPHSHYLCLLRSRLRINQPSPPSSQLASLGLLRVSSSASSNRRPQPLRRPCNCTLQLRSRSHTTYTPRNYHRNHPPEPSPEPLPAESPTARPLHGAGHRLPTTDHRPPNVSPNCRPPALGVQVEQQAREGERSATRDPACRLARQQVLPASRIGAAVRPLICPHAFVEVIRGARATFPVCLAVAPVAPVAQSLEVSIQAVAATRRNPLI